MAIYRGSGGSTSTTDQATIDQVAEDAATATTKASEAASSASDAASSASSASSSASSASSSASTATTKASEASTSATNAASSASAASTSATAAASSASTASSSATTATTQAGIATTKAAEAAQSETDAQTAEANAQDYASDAQKSAYGAEDALQTLSDSSTLYSARHYAAKAAADGTSSASSATAAAASATAAAASETAAASSETAAASSETAAATSETNAATSATAAASSATSAASSATSANSSEASALTYRNEASTFASNASTSATAASQSATSAATSATNASTSENNAQTYASNALTYSNSASASADAALAALDSFDDRYLGQKTSDPTVDNDGNALVAGALYFNTTDDVMKVYEGSSWVAAYVSAEGLVQSTGDTMTGDLDFGDNVEARFGASQDLRVFHDGSGGNSHVLSTNPYLVLDASTAVLTDCNLQPNSGSFDLGTAGIPWRDTYTTGVKNNGAMTIRGSGYVYLQSYAGEQMVRCTENAGVELFYNNDAKLASTSTGVTVTGRAVGTQVTDNDLSFDLQAGNSFVCTPAANGTLTFTNITAGQSGNIILINNGGYAISAAATTYISAADVTTISTAGIYLLSYNSASSNVFVSASAALTSAGA